MRSGSLASGLVGNGSPAAGAPGSGSAADERYARAALTYLAEPADRVLGALIRVHGATRTLEAIKAGKNPSDAAPISGGPAGPDDLATRDDLATPHDLAGPGRPLGPAGPAGPPRSQVQRAMERWQVRLAELPTPADVTSFTRSGIRLVCPGDREWPGQLADLGDEQPYALWLRGTADLRFSCLRSVAVVGARAATAYGSYVAAEFAASVAARGWAVLACGVDVPYPAAHAELLESVAAQGVIVSEWPPGRQVTRLRFLVRNRVIAALATGTLVVEAGQRSGALSTARHARDLGRRLMAVPGPVTSDLSAGCHHIIREWQGALVTSAADVIEFLSPVGAPQNPGPAVCAEAGDGPVQPAGVPSGPGRPASGRYAPPAVDRDVLDLESATILDAMPRRGGMGTSRVAQRAGLTPGTALRCLGGLAAAGFVERCEEGWRLRRV